MLFRFSFWTAISTGSSGVVLITLRLMISFTCRSLPSVTTAFETSYVVMIPTSMPSPSRTGRWFVSSLRSRFAATRISSSSVMLITCRFMMSLTRGVIAVSRMGLTRFVGSIRRVGRASSILPSSIQPFSSCATARARR